MRYLTFEEDELKVLIRNQKGIQIGWLESLRVGAWMSWCLSLMDDDIYVSALCLDEIRVKMKELNARNKVKKKCVNQ